MTEQAHDTRDMTPAGEEFSGKTIEEATQAASEKFGLDAEKLDIEILAQPGSLTSLFGKKARINARPKAKNKVIDELKFDIDLPRREAPTADDNGNFQPTEALAIIATTILPEAKVSAHETDQHLQLDIHGDGSGIFIGRKGSTLDAIQFLMNRMAQKQGYRGKRILVDAEGYRQRRIDELIEQTHKLAERVRQSGRPLRTDMLDAAMRKIVHAEVKTLGGLHTRSLGNGDMKRVQIAPASHSRRR